MTGWDVASDAVKIGLPLVLGGAITLLTVRITRKHSERVERRKRVQDALESMARTLTLLLQANEEHHLYCRDQYFQLREKTEFWLQEFQEVVARMNRYDKELEERCSVAVVLGENFDVEQRAFYAALNACNKAFKEPGKTEAEIKAIESEATFAHRTFLARIAARHAKA